MFSRVTQQIMINPEHVEAVVLFKYVKNGVPGSFIRIQFVSGEHIDINKTGVTLQMIMQALGGNGPIDPEDDPIRNQ